MVPEQPLTATATASVAMAVAVTAIVTLLMLFVPSPSLFEPNAHRFRTQSGPAPDKLWTHPTSSVWQCALQCETGEPNLWRAVVASIRRVLPFGAPHFWLPHRPLMATQKEPRPVLTSHRLQPRNHRQLIAAVFSMDSAFCAPSPAKPTQAKQLSPSHLLKTTFPHHLWTSNTDNFLPETWASVKHEAPTSTLP